AQLRDAERDRLHADRRGAGARRVVREDRLGGVGGGGGEVPAQRGRRTDAPVERTELSRRAVAPAPGWPPAPATAAADQRPRRVSNVGLVSRWDRPFQARFTRCAATAALRGLRTSSHQRPTRATMPTSAWE